MVRGIYAKKDLHIRGRAGRNPISCRTCGEKTFSCSMMSCGAVGNAERRAFLQNEKPYIYPSHSPHGGVASEFESDVSLADESFLE